ncbi:hypothetical protein [Streptacidiphilus jiangxiensis]|uniref:hypothetical protein n=1 Tax=Streptacidiphilus jiangxiensis TaxID=235985 RepID=UPI00116033E2|nr:hypothetical protein [Streptacidiphilus jiangxiensis]
MTESVSGGGSEERREEASVRLRAEPGRYVDAVLRADGALVLKGQLLRPGLPEYEYVVTLPAEQVPALLDSLGVAAVGGLLPALLDRSEEITPRTHAWLRELGLRPELWVHLED